MCEIQDVVWEPVSSAELGEFTETRKTSSRI